MKYLLNLLAFYFWIGVASAQKKINDESIRYQQERMVFKQWDRNKFTPTSGFLGLNPYYWLTWGLHPNYPKTDLRPLSAWGPQAQRLGMTATMHTSSNSYKLHSDTLGNTALMEIAGQSGVFSSADPLWMIYYSKELRPVLEYSTQSILSPFSPVVRTRLIDQGLFAWYKNELDKLKERLEGARSADMDRGSRILAYHRILKEYQSLQASWTTRTVSAERDISQQRIQQKLQSNQISTGSWTPASDVEIAKQVLSTRKY